MNRRLGTLRPRRPVIAMLAAALAVTALARGGDAAVWTSTDVRLSEASDISLTSPSGGSMAMAADGSLYAVWYERKTGGFSVIRGAARTPDGNWIDRVTISQGDSLSISPAVAIGPEGDLHVAWEDVRDGNSEIYYRYRNPAGTWSAEERLTTNQLPSNSPSLAVATDGRVHLAWSDASVGNFEIFHRYRDPGGPWSPPSRLTIDAGLSLTPVLAVEPSGIVHMVWNDNVIGGTLPEDTFNTEIYHLRLDEDGVPVSPLFRVSQSIGTSKQPSLALGPDGSLHIVWGDNRDRASSNSDSFPFAIWYRRWLPGLGFGHEKRFCFSTVNHSFPTVAIGPDGTVNVAFEDFSHGNSEIYFRQIRQSTGWDVAKTRLTMTSGPTRHPSILADASGNLHLVWADTSPGEESSIRYREGRVDATTPVVLARAGAEWRGDELVVSWETTSEFDHAGFALYAVDDLEEEAVRLSADPMGEGPRYSAIVGADEIEGRRYLKLVEISRGGTLETVAVLQVPVRNGAPRPPVARLGNVYPNPAPGTFTVPFFTERGGHAVLNLVDVAGRRVDGLDLGQVPPGEVTVSWSPSAGRGRPAAGRYWIQMQLDGGDRPAAVPVVLRHP